MKETEEKKACDGADASRREFLQTGGCFMLVLTALGLPSTLPVFMTSAEAAATERRYPIPATDSVNIDRQAQVILIRFQNNVYAFALSCPHENAAVKWLPKDHRFQCTKHDSQYQPNGVHTSGRATRNLDRFVIRREDSSAVVDLQHWFQSDKDPSGWMSAAIQL